MEAIKGPASVNAPELLSVYMDYFIKQLTKGSSSNKDISLKSGDQTEDLISNSIQFLRFIKDKDALKQTMLIILPRGFKFQNW